MSSYYSTLPVPWKPESFRVLTTIDALLVAESRYPKLAIFVFEGPTNPKVTEIQRCMFPLQNLPPHHYEQPCSFYATLPYV